MPLRHVGSRISITYKNAITPNVGVLLPRYRYHAKESEAGTDPDFYWLGHIPCRFVLIYGMVVGVQVYEQRVVYTGTFYYTT
jgi:hypothetical protein